MRHFINSIDTSADELVLYHGTLKDNVESIGINGLEAQIGKTVEHFYSGYEDVVPTVFASDVTGLRKCTSAIGHQLWNKTGDRTYGYSYEGMREHGALCVIKAEADHFSHADKDSVDYGTHPPHVEPNDYYTDRDITVDFILVGDELMNFLEENGIHLPKRNLQESIVNGGIEYEEWYDKYGEWVGEAIGLEEDELPKLFDLFWDAVGTVEFNSEKEIYRGMTINKNYLKRFMKGAETVNVHWTTNFDIAQRFSGEGTGHGNDMRVILVAQCKPEYVDLGMSIALELIQYEGEQEIRLKEHTDINIHKIIFLNEEHKPVISIDTNITTSTGSRLDWMN